MCVRHQHANRKTWVVIQSFCKMISSQSPSEWAYCSTLLERSEQTCHHVGYYAYSWLAGWSWPTSVSFNSSPFGVLISVYPRTWAATRRQAEWEWTPGLLHACILRACVVNPLVNTTALARPLAHLAACSAQLLVTRLGPPLHLGSTFDRQDWHTRWQGCL